ncbi:hypothetical protein D3C85_1162130 [compost metagenome]
MFVYLPALVFVCSQTKRFAHSPGTLVAVLVSFVLLSLGVPLAASVALPALDALAVSAVVPLLVTYLIQKSATAIRHVLVAIVE